MTTMSFTNDIQRKLENLNIICKIDGNETQIKNELRDVFNFFTEIKELSIFTFFFKFRNIS